MLKLLGAGMIVCGCFGVGLAMCRSHRRTETMLEQLSECIGWMMLELDYRTPPLAQLCRQAGERTAGPVGGVFTALAEALERQLVAHVSTCMEAVLAENSGLPTIVENRLRSLGECLGEFDLAGQLRLLEAEQKKCQQELEALRRDGQTRLRNYRTLGLCAGVALAILLL